MWHIDIAYGWHLRLLDGGIQDVAAIFFAPRGLRRWLYASCGRMVSLSEAAGGVGCHLYLLMWGRSDLLGATRCNPCGGVKSCMLLAGATHYDSRGGTQSYTLPLDRRQCGSG
jgi:hypothetical protein